MKTLRSRVEGRWHEADGGFTDLLDPANERPIARASSRGIDFAAAVEYARSRGGPALRELTLSQRGDLLAAMASALHAQRDELLALSTENGGATRSDAKFDVDGGTFTLSHYAELGRSMGRARAIVDGDGAQLGRSPRLWGQHVLVPRTGVAVHVNAFNFPVWGWAEKAACALLAGMPVVTKPATSTAAVAARCTEILVDAGVLPDGVFSMVCGGAGDLLDRLGPQDVLAFTGSADTALALRGRANLLAASTRFNVEADSLNAAVLGPDVEPGSETWSAFVRDVVREMTQKTGQKCTAVRRIVVPAGRADGVEQALVAELAEVVTGDPRDGSVRMGPLATAAQLADAEAGVAALAAEARVVLGTGRRVDGVGAPSGKGFFLAPTLLRIDGSGGGEVHRREVFGPVATIVTCDGTAGAAAEIVGRGGGTLVTSAWSDDGEWIGAFAERAAATTGRLYVGSEKVAGQLPGSGLVLPHLVHGGPGRAGGGEELGGWRGPSLYSQRVAVAGDRAVVERLAGLR